MRPRQPRSPKSLYRAFVHSREHQVTDNKHRNGESQRSVGSSNSRKRWPLAKRLTPAQLQALRDFHEVRKGPTQPFDFYEAYETTPSVFPRVGLKPRGRNGESALGGEPVLVSLRSHHRLPH